MDIAKLLTSPHLALIEVIVEHAVDAIESIGETDEETLLRNFNMLQTNLLRELVDLCPSKHYNELIDYWNEEHAAHFRKVFEFLVSKLDKE